MRVERGRTAGGVAYTVRGSGPPILWLSGYVASVAVFDVVLRELAEASTVVALDHRGSGRSRTRPLPTSTRTMARDALSVLDWLGINAAHIVGASLGGMVAQELAIGWPHRVRSLVLCSTSAGGLGARPPALRDFLTGLGHIAPRMPAGVGARPVGVLVQAAAAASHDATRRLDRIQAPTLVIHGDEDPLVPHVDGMWLSSHIPGARLEVIRGGDHLVALESPTVRTLLREWLHDHRAQPPGAAPSSKQQFAHLATAPCRALRGQTLPLRRVGRIARRKLLT